jgi:nucleoside-triphosphatase THEP1
VEKTTVIQAVVAQLGASAGGFYTEEIRETRKNGRAKRGEALA